MIDKTDIVLNSMWIAKDSDTKFMITKFYAGSLLGITRLEDSEIKKGYLKILEGMGNIASGIVFPLLNEIKETLDKLPEPWEYKEQETITVSISNFYNGDFIPYSEEEHGIRKA